MPRLWVHGSVNMGKVAAKMKVMPQSPEVDLDDLQERLENVLPEGAKISRVDREDVAFGLIAMFPTVIIPDEAGGTDAVEDAFAEVEGVESVDVDEVGRI
jgi:elongation factor 1-beta